MGERVIYVKIDCLNEYCEKVLQVEVDIDDDIFTVVPESDDQIVCPHCQNPMFTDEIEGRREKAIIEQVFEQTQRTVT